MIEKSKIAQIAEDFLSNEQFLVEVSVSASNKIEVVIDSEDGISIDSCIKLSKAIEEVLDRDEEDFELQVSSAGLGQPLKVYRQYVKNIDREVEVVKTDGSKEEGIIKSVNETSFELEVNKKVKLEGKKKKELVVETQQVSFDEAKTVKNIIKF
ncbi:MAG: ribosome assembly cofactor RimP [Mangrovibacterium sp.]